MIMVKKTTPAFFIVGSFWEIRCDIAGPVDTVEFSFRVWTITCLLLNNQEGYLVKLSGPWWGGEPSPEGFSGVQGGGAGHVCEIIYPGSCLGGFLPLVMFVWGKCPASK